MDSVGVLVCRFLGLASWARAKQIFGGKNIVDSEKLVLLFYTATTNSNNNHNTANRCLAEQGLVKITLCFIIL